MENINDGQHVPKKKTTTSKKRNRLSDDEEYMPVPETNGVIRRVFSHKDEITLLKTLAKQEDKSDMKLLFDTVTTSLDAKVNKKQVAEKVSKLKKWYNKNSWKNVKDLDPHQKQLSKLSNQVWGGDKKMTVDEIISRYPRVEYGLDFMYPSQYLPKVRRRLASLSHQELGLMERKWFQFYYRQMQHGHKRMRLIEQVSKLVDDATKAYKLQRDNKRRNYKKTIDEYLDNYPGVDLGLCDLYPPRALSSGRLHMLRRMVASYPCYQELDVLEDKWEEFDKDAEWLDNKLIKVIDKQIDLVEKATGEVIPTLT